MRSSEGEKESTSSERERSARWTMVPYFWLRSAGFPFVELERLRAAPAVVKKIDAAILADQRLEQMRERMRTRLRSHSRIPQKPAPMPKRHPSTVEKLLAKSELIPPSTTDLFDDTHQRDWAEEIEGWGELLHTKKHAWAEAEAAIGPDLLERRKALRELCKTDTFLEAVFISSPLFSAALQSHLDVEFGPRLSKSRQIERTAVMFQQRVRAKNETVSFFGPIAWGKVDHTLEDRLRATAGPGALIARRMVSFEHWGIQGLARRIGADPEVAAHLTPILNPACFRVTRKQLFYPVARMTDLDEHQATVLDLCDGEVTWHEMLERARTAAAFRNHPPEKVIEVADRLLQHRILLRGIAIPTVIARPELRLRAELEQLADRTGGKWVKEVTSLCKLIERYTYGTFVERADLLSQLNFEFEGLSGEASTRRPGETYAARGLIYEDCERRMRDLRLGPALEKEIEQLAPVLDLARWISCELSSRYQELVLQVQQRLDQNDGTGVDFLQFARETEWILNDDSVESDLKREIEDAWEERLADRLGLGQDEIEVDEKDFHAVLDRLGGPHSEEESRSFLGADYHSPDFLIAARSIEDLNKGNGRIVLGELHKSVFMTVQPVAQPFCPYTNELLHCVGDAVGEEVISMVDSPKSYLRSNFNWPDVQSFFEVVTEGATSRFPGERVIPVGAMRVVEENGRVFGVSRDGKHKAEIFSILSSTLQRKLLKLDPLMIRGPRTPRVVMGKFIIARRVWRFVKDQLPNVDAPPDSAAYFAVARKFCHEHGLPEHVFIKSSDQPKPIYIDFSSFFFAEIFLKLAAQAETLSVSEMIPAPDQLWLLDSDGKGYTCELRTTLLRRNRGHERRNP